LVLCVGIGLPIILAAPLQAQSSALVEPHCLLWGPPDRVGGKPVCRRRAAPPSAELVSCRLYTQTLDRETGNKMCIYRRPGLTGGDTTVSVPASTPCAMSLRC
jgi:hypothetical protein